MIKTLGRTLAMALVLNLTACGGGGGSSGGSSTQAISVDHATVSLNPAANSTIISQDVSVSFKGDGVLADLAPGFSDPGWISIDQSTDVANGNVHFLITADTTGLAPGTYQVTLRFTTGTIPPGGTIQNATNVSYVDLPITLVVTGLSSCDPTQAGCVRGQFTADQVVANLDYQCGNVRSVTDGNGLFTCPSNSVATFFIGTPDTANQVVLGQTTIVPQTLPVNGVTVSGIASVKVTDLVTIAPGADPSSNTQVLNIVRLLKALDSDGSFWNQAGYSGFNGSNRIVIADASRALAKTYLSATIPASAFAQGDLLDSTALKNFIQQARAQSGAHPADNGGDLGIPSAAVAQLQLASFLKGSYAGIYMSSGTTCVYDPATNSSFYDLGMCNPSASSTALKSGDLIMLVDRTGYGYGFGFSSTNKNIVQWDDTSIPNQGPAYPFYVVNGAVTGNAQNTALVQRPFNYTNNRLALTATADTVTNLINAGGTVSSGPSGTFTWAGTLKAKAIASTPANYKILYNGQSVPVLSQLGMWTFSSSAQPTRNVTAGQFFMYNAMPANPYLDAGTFGAPTLNLPLNLSLGFQYNDSSCPTDISNLTTYFCKTLNTIAVSIMKNGNIITDINHDCSAISADANDPDNDAGNSTPRNLVDAKGQTEYRVGLVRTATADGRLSLSLLFPKLDDALYNASYQNLTGTIAGFSSSTLVLLPTSGSKALTVSASDGISWSNYFKSIQALVTPKSATSSMQAFLPPDAQGILLISPRSCQ